MSNNILFIFLLLLLSTGCTAYKYTLPADQGKRYFQENSDFRNISLGIDLKRDFTAYSPPYEMDEIISELHKEKIFKEVNYVNKLENEPNLILLNYSNISPQNPDCWTCLFALVSLGIVPRIINEEDEIEFTFRSPADSATVSITPKAEYSEVLGWVSGILRISPSWKGNYDDRNFFHSFYNLLYEKRDELIQLSNR